MFMSPSCETAVRWMPQNTFKDKSMLVQLMAWCRQATSHYLSQCWPRSVSPYAITKPQWVSIGPRSPPCGPPWHQPPCRLTSWLARAHFSDQFSITIHIWYFISLSLSPQLGYHYEFSPYAALPCAQLSSHQSISFIKRAKWNFWEILITMEKFLISNAWL